MLKRRMLGALGLAVALLLAGSGFAVDPPAKDKSEKNDKKGDTAKKGGDSARTVAKPGTVTGTVTYDGKIVPVGYINFHPEKGIGVIVEIHYGKYTAEKVPAGPVIVTVRTAEMRQMYNGLKKAREAGGVGKVITQLPGAGKGGGTAKDLNKKLEDKKKPPLPGAKELAKKLEEAWANLKDMIDVPEKFADPEKSGLKYTIKSGPQELNIDMPKVESKKKGDK